MPDQNSSDSRLRLLGALFIAATAVFIPVIILGQGFLPTDDALFYAAKAVSGKNWDEILLLGPGFNVEYLRFGWTKILGLVHSLSGMDQDALVGFAIIVQFFLFAVLPCLLLSHPEAWIGTLFVLSICIPAEMTRFLIGRPMTFSISAFVLILLLIGKNGNRPAGPTWVLCGGLIALGTYIHAPWYFLLFLPGFFLARAWEKAGRLFLAVPAGIGLGALLTGHPVDFLEAFYRIYSRVAGAVWNPNFLVTELRPIPLNFQVFVLVSLVLLLLKERQVALGRAIDNPIFLSFIFGAFAGLRTGRIWLDIGVPALAAWLAWQGEELLESIPGYTGGRKLLVTLIVSGALFLSLTPDFSERWTARSRDVFLSTENPLQQGWLPEPGGILYSPNMEIFYDSFFSNPKADWKYILGFDGSLMPPEDYEIRKEMLWNRERPEYAKTFLPWIRKMTKADRFAVKGMVLEGHFMELDWRYMGGNVSVGRKPVPNDRAVTPLSPHEPPTPDK